jgi:hypothetical protein
MPFQYLIVCFEEIEEKLSFRRVGLATFEQYFAFVTHPPTVSLLASFQTFS